MFPEVDAGKNRSLVCYEGNRFWFNDRVDPEDADPLRLRLVKPILMRLPEMNSLFFVFLPRHGKIFMVLAPLMDSGA